MKLTGRKRFRTERRWGRERLVLQVEYEYLYTDCIAGRIDTERCIAWRDATVKDLTIKMSGSPDE